MQIQKLYKRLPFKVRNVLFYLGIFLRVYFFGYVLYLYNIYIFPIKFKIFGLRLSYLIGIGFIILIYNYWHKLIKRRLYPLIFEGGRKI